MEDLAREFQNLGPTLFPTRERAPAGAGSGGLMVTFMLPGAATGSVTGKMTVIVTVKTPVETPVETPVKVMRAETPEKTPEKTPVETPVQTPPETPDAILRLLRAEPNVSARELAARIGRSDRTIERAIVKLRESGRLERVGPDKGGRWRVIA